MNAQDLLKHILLPLESGNPVATMERLLGTSCARKTTTFLWDRTLKRMIRDRVTVREKEVLLGLLKSKSVSIPDIKDVSAIKEMAVTSSVSSSLPGTAFSLLVGGAEENAFGCMHPVSVVASKNGKGSLQIIMKEGLTTEVSQSIHAAIGATRHTLECTYGLTMQGHRNLDNYGLYVQVGRSRHAYDGASAGLPVVVAMVSALLGIPVSTSAAFTGSVRVTGEVEMVRGIPQKIEVACLKEIERIYVPADNGDDAKSAARGRTEVVPIGSINEVLPHIFDLVQIESFTNRLNSETPANLGLAPIMLPFETDRPRVLISAVGKRDPYGASFQKPEEFSEGAILTAFRLIKPDTVILLPTKGTHGNAMETNVQLKAIDPKATCLIEPIQVNDPTDYDMLSIAIRAVLHGHQAILEDNVVYLALSSGTAQMQAVFISLLQTGKLHAWPIQVKEPVWASSWEDRLKLVKSEYLNIGCIY